MGCIVNIESVKNDAAGRGHRYYFAKATRQKKNRHTASRGSRTLWCYVQHTRPGSHCPFFHIPKLRWTLKPPYLNKKLREMAEMYGVNLRRVSSHSLRIPHSLVCGYRLPCTGIPTLAKALYMREPPSCIQQGRLPCTFHVVQPSGSLGSCPWTPVGVR